MPEDFSIVFFVLKKQLSEKYLIMCEGPNEKKIIDMLLEKQKRPKEFAKENIIYNRRSYKGDTNFYEEYYKDIDKLIREIMEYRQRNHAHKDDEHYLTEIINM